MQFPPASLSSTVSPLEMQRLNDDRPMSQLLFAVPQSVREQNKNMEKITNGGMLKETVKLDRKKG
jgi:hypothetical protein